MFFELTQEEQKQYEEKKRVLTEFGKMYRI